MVQCKQCIYKVSQNKNTVWCSKLTIFQNWYKLCNGLRLVNYNFHLGVCEVSQPYMLKVTKL